MGEYFKEKLGFEYMYPNELDMENDLVTGRVKGEIVDGKKKAALLREIAQKADSAIFTTGLDGLLYLMGLYEREIRESNAGAGN